MPPPKIITTPSASEPELPVAPTVEPSAPPPASLAAGAPATPPPSLSPTVTCWDCDAPNPPGRVFCVECGTFIAVGAKVFSGGASSGEAAPDRSVVAPLTPGAMSLGAYSVAMRRQAQRRRVLLGVASAALVAVVGLASLYVATSPRGGGGEPAPAALAAATPVATEDAATAARRNVGPAVGIVDLSEVELEPPPAPAMSEPDAVAEGSATEIDTAEPAVADPVEAAPAAEPAPAAQPVDGVEVVPADGVEAVADPDPRPETEAEPLTSADVAVPPDEVAVPPGEQVEPEAPAEPEATTEPEPVAEPGTDAEPDPAPERAEPRAEEEEAIVWRNGWVCDGELALQDTRLRDWTITRASFLPGNGYERLVLMLDRIGPGSGEPASLTVEAFPRTRVAQKVPGVRQPSLGRTAIAIQFSDGVKTDLTLRGYRPSGLVTIRELSAYPAGGRASRVIVSASADGCFRVRTPAWSSSSRAQKGQIVIDVKS